MDTPTKKKNPKIKANQIQLSIQFCWEAKNALKIYHFKAYYFFKIGHVLKIVMRDAAL